MRENSASKDLTNPQYIGPGEWNLMQQYAFTARTVSEHQEAVKMIRFAIANFNCPHCREDAERYLQNFPPEESIGKEAEINGEMVKVGVFMWIWRFHNSVNTKLGKKVLSWEAACNIYNLPASSCSNICALAGVANVAEKNKPPLLEKDTPPIPGTVIEPLLISSSKKKRLKRGK